MLASSRFEVAGELVSVLAERHQLVRGIVVVAAANCFAHVTRGRRGAERVPELLQGGFRGFRLRRRRLHSASDWRGGRRVHRRIEGRDRGAIERRIVQGKRGILFVCEPERLPLA